MESDPAEIKQSVRSYVNEPHAAICAQASAPTLNLVASESEAVRSASAELAREKPQVALSALKNLPLLSMPKRHAVLISDVSAQHLERILLKTYDRAPDNFETLLGMEGVGARTLRALALASEVIYGTPASTPRKPSDDRDAAAIDANATGCQRASTIARTRITMCLWSAPRSSVSRSPRGVSTPSPVRIGRCSPC